MPVKLRLQRRGKKDNAFFHIVVADGRAPRDGAFIEKIGSYNPCTNPATIDIDFEKAMSWLDKGAQPTDTCRAILSYKGIIYKRHLMGGVKKGAFTAEQAEAKFQKWVLEKDGKVNAKKDKIGSAGTAAKAKKHEEEKSSQEAKALKIAAKKSEIEIAAAAKVEETPSKEETTAPAPE